MRAEILAVGSELLDPVRQETNGGHITRKLLEIGIEVGARITVADDLALLTSAFKAALARADVVLATGAYQVPKIPALTSGFPEHVVQLHTHEYRNPEQLPDGEVALSFEVEDARVERAMDAAYKRVANRVDIAGFRRGKAPRQLVEREGDFFKVPPGRAS